MGNRSSKPLELRVVRAAETTLAAQRYVSPVDVLVGLGWLAPSRVDEWRQGRVTSLERVVQANLHKQSTAMRILRRWAVNRGLLPRETVYVAYTRGRPRLRFSVSGNPDIERAYRTHWVSPALSAAKRERLAAAALVEAASLAAAEQELRGDPADQERCGDVVR